MKRALTPALVVLMMGLWTAAGQETKKDTDPLALDSQWKGKVTQRGKIRGVKEIPPEFATVLVVTKRKDNDFECELREKVGDANVTYHCKGKIAPAGKDAFKVDFASVAVKSSSDGFIAVQQIPYTGTITAKTLKGTWKLPLNKEDTELDGEFSFERQ